MTNDTLSNYNDYSGLIPIVIVYKTTWYEQSLPSMNLYKPLIGHIINFWVYGLTAIVCCGTVLYSVHNKHYCSVLFCYQNEEAGKLTASNRLM